MRWRPIRALLLKELAGYRQQIAGDHPVLLWVAGIALLLASAWTPLVLGEYWIESLPMLCAYPMIATIVGIHGALDAFAGERERHTLETLMATPLRETELIAGKLLGTLAIAFALGLGPVVIGLIALGLSTGRVMLPAGEVLWGLPLFTGVFALAMSSGALYVSLMSASVRNATQVFGYVLGGFLIVIPVLAVSLPDAVVAVAGRWIEANPGTRILLIVDLAFAAIAGVALAHLRAYVVRGRPELL